jgi:hypothetical protein
LAAGLGIFQRKEIAMSEFKVSLNLLILGAGAIAIYYLVLKPVKAAAPGATALAGGVGSLETGVGAVAGDIGTGLQDLLDPNTYATLFSAAPVGAVAGIDTNVADANGQNGQTPDSIAHTAAVLAGTATGPYIPPTTQSSAQLTGGASQ